MIFEYSNFVEIIINVLLGMPFDNVIDEKYFSQEKEGYSTYKKYTKNFFLIFEYISREMQSRIG